MDQGFDFVHAGTANTKASETEGGKGEYDLTRQAVRFIDENKDNWAKVRVFDAAVQ